MKQKSGRHKKEDYNVKSKELHIRLTEGELAVTKDLAEMRNMSVSEYVRRLILDEFELYLT